MLIQPLVLFKDDLYLPNMNDASAYNQLTFDGSNTAIDPFHRGTASFKLKDFGGDERYNIKSKGSDFSIKTHKSTASHCLIIRLISFS